MSDKHRLTHVAVLSAVVVAGLLGASCATSPTHPAAGSATSIATTTTTQAVEITTPTVVLNGRSVKVPTEDGAAPIVPSVATGQQIILTTTGFLPQTLYAALETPVVWTNLTPHTATITVEHVGMAPVSLAPGATFTYTPKVLDFGYRSSTGDYGLVNVGAFDS